MQSSPTEYPRGFTPTPDSENPIYKLTLPAFDGPLDLLLFLIKKHDLDIFDIPISFITGKYLEHLEILSDLDIDVAAGFLTLAAELAHIKSKMLVPQPENADDQEDEDLGDPRAELVRRLLEYQKYKDAGKQLAERDVLGRDSFARAVVPDAAELQPSDDLAEVPIFRLIEALDRLLKKGQLEIKHHVVVDQLSVADRLNALIDRLRVEETITFSALFSGMSTRREVILTFLALLEVTKLKLVRIHQIDTDGEIFLRAVKDKIQELDGNPAGLAGSKEGADEYR
ncbi:MAG: segregation/condensation protein A [Deltaproteobacteria bacterium]|nr:segregation/condensation protein A [Deltaproteobacteria bacterium]